MRRSASRFIALASAVLLAVAPSAGEMLAIRGAVVHTMGPAGSIRDGTILVADGRIIAVGPSASTAIPDGCRTMQAAVVTPGLIDAHCTVGISGIYNQKHDSDQLESSAPIQPELRAIDAYNPQERLVEYVRSFGVTTIHTGHAPGELISGQTAIVKTYGRTVEEAVLKPTAAIAVTLGPSSAKSGGKSPGTRGKQIALLRAELIKAQEFVKKQSSADVEKQPERNLRLEALAGALRGETPLLVTCHRAQDIVSALRLAREFGLKLWLDGAAEAYAVLDEIKASGVPVFVHPLMTRSWGECENLSFETPAKLRAAGIPIVFQAGYEDYVPKTRVVLFEAAIAAANGLKFDEALAGVTIESARILGIDGRVGSLEVGKDADAALYDGDPFEYTTHCVGVVIGGEPVSLAVR